MIICGAGTAGNLKIYVVALSSLLCLAMPSQTCCRCCCSPYLWRVVFSLCLPLIDMAAAYCWYWALIAGSFYASSAVSLLSPCWMDWYEALPEWGGKLAIARWPYAQKMILYFSFFRIPLNTLFAVLRSIYNWSSHPQWLTGTVIVVHWFLGKLGQ